MQASFYFSFGPDNSGKAIRRIFRKGFLEKMRRTNAAKLYGFRTMLYGVLLPAPIIWKRASAQMQAAREAGHEVGIHAWDHVQYHDLLDRKSRGWLEDWFARAHEAFGTVFGGPAKGAVSPAWRCNDNTLEIQEGYHLGLCRRLSGKRAILSHRAGRALRTLQIPTTLPTLDELLGLDGRSARQASDEVLGLLKEGELNVYALHTEVEGGALSQVFETFLEGLEARGVQARTHADCCQTCWPPNPPAKPMVRREIAGRPGWASFEGE